MNQSQQFPPPKRPTGSSSYEAQQDELHLPGSGIGSGIGTGIRTGPGPSLNTGVNTTQGHTQSPSQGQHGLLSMPMSMSPRDYAPQISFDQASPPGNSQSHSPYQPSSSVPNVLQPGGLSAPARPSASSSNTAPSLPTMQSSVTQLQSHSQSSPLQQASSQPPLQSGFQSPPTQPALNMSHSYSRSSPSTGYDASSNYHAYTPTTPQGGSSSSQFMSPTDAGRYNAPGSQRNISNTPLGLADIRPRADSSMSDGAAGTIGYDASNTQPGTSNYIAPWAVYAFDWCKWAPQGNGAGKVALGSYLEDGHNFVCLQGELLRLLHNSSFLPHTNTGDRFKSSTAT